MKKALDKRLVPVWRHHEEASQVYVCIRAHNASQLHVDDMLTVRTSVYVYIMHVPTGIHGQIHYTHLYTYTHSHLDAQIHT